MGEGMGEVDEEISFSRKLATTTAHSRHFTRFSAAGRRDGTRLGWDEAPPSGREYKEQQKQEKEVLNHSVCFILHRNPQNTTLRKRNSSGRGEGG
ncbi:hypothetical protein E2C01_069134 [Portunus trituberculatus]|uniref:Uncharacterized protein n=1 Tax=Portunus trituberculatus TaxID=210409 RepID=A0A5B7HYK3_PORTR|nr:hypothetical protein [Portunus trituberculatus]